MTTPITSSTKPLKIAVQLFGHLRTYEACAPTLKTNLLDIYDCDVFMHTWDALEHNSPTWYHESSKFNPLAVDTQVTTKITKFYNPVALTIETQDFIHEEGLLGPHKLSLKGIKYMLYGQHTVNALRLAHEAKTGTEYDYVITLRPDLLLLRPIRFPDYAPEFTFNPRTSIHLVHKEVTQIINERITSIPLMMDCMYIAKPDVMTTVTGCYKQFDRYMRELPQLLPEYVINPEVALREYLQEHNVAPRLYRFYYAIKRKNRIDDLILYPPEMLTGPLQRELWMRKARRNLFLSCRKIALGVFAISRALIPSPLRKKLISILESHLAALPQGRKRATLSIITKYLAGN